MSYKKEQWMLGNNPDPSKFEDIHTNAGWYRRKKKARGSNVNAIFKKMPPTFLTPLLLPITSCPFWSLGC